MDLFCHHCQILSGPLNEVSHLMANNEFKKFNNEFNNNKFTSYLICNLCIQHMEVYETIVKTFKVVHKQMYWIRTNL